MCRQENCCTCHMCLKVADTIWSWLVVAPLSVLYWAGTWKLMDQYVVPDDKTVSGWISLGVGSGICIIAYLILPLLGEKITVRCHVNHILVSRIIIHIQNFGTLNFWRGVWQLMDTYAGAGWEISLVCYCVAHVLLILMKASSNTTAVPFIITLDTRRDFYHTAPLFRSQHESPLVYVADSVFSHVIIRTLVVQVWRGLWNVMDTFLYPDDKLLSYGVCLGAGYGAALVLALLQYPLYHAARALRQKHHLLELLLEDIYKILITFTTIVIWRGGWGLCRDFVITVEEHSWLAHGCGSAGLLLLQVASSVGTTTMMKDCEVGHGHGMILPIDYFRYFCRRRTESPRGSVQGHRDEPASTVERHGLLAPDSSDDSDFEPILPGYRRHVIN